MTLSWNDRHNQHRPDTEHATRHLHPIPDTTTGEPSRYALTALERETATVRSAPEGTRNHTLNTAAFNLGQIVAAGQLPPGTVEDQLLAAAQSAGLPATEARRTIHSGLTGGVKSGPRQIAPMPPELTGPALTINHATVEHIDEQTGEITEQRIDFWTARPQHQTIRDFALARMTSPWAVLGVVLLRALATIPPAVTLPPLIGGPGSLNLFAALVGPSGVGKGAAEAAAADACHLAGASIYTAPVGSGEGIAHQYAHREKREIVQDRTSVLFSVPEVDTLTALGNRQGSTLLSQLRSAFSGERLGFGYADPQKRIPIERHSYRLGMVVGVQPEKAGPLLDDSDGGTPQRFIWLPAVDTDITDQPPIPPDPWRTGLARWHELAADTRTGMRYIPIPDTVAQEVRTNHAARARGEGTALDGHSMFAREKVAVALAVLDGRNHMNDEDWQLSGIVMRASDITRTRVTTTLSEQSRKAEERRAEAGARRAVAVEEAVTDAAVQRVCRNLQRHITTAGDIDWGDLRRKLASRDRDHFEDAVARLVEAGQISVDEVADSRAPDGVARTVKAVTE